MEVPHKTNRPHQVRRIWPCMQVPHKTNRILYTLTPEELIQFGPDHRDYKPHPQFVVKFYYHKKRVSGRHRPKIDLEFRERERKTSYEWIQVDNFDSFEDAKMEISPTLSKLDIKEKFHEEIVEKIVECGKSFTSRMIEADNGGGIFIPIIVRMLRLKAIWRCKFEGLR
ncbi:hypothetical protein TIFTF001_011022 [Ficus carica]|uniref:Uncharacterized protein n=1 Tax=Ficus carica TaxID=3494 RepID=A0AA88D3V8_FICCA|nr:hypothetical protein TIFTF001_011022 [Ficus carica]